LTENSLNFYHWSIRLSGYKNDTSKPSPVVLMLLQRLSNSRKNKLLNIMLCLSL
jgi:hypothetical protein